MKIITDILTRVKNMILIKVFVVRYKGILKGETV